MLLSEIWKNIEKIVLEVLNSTLILKNQVLKTSFSLLNFIAFNTESSGVKHLFHC